MKEDIYPSPEKIMLLNKSCGVRVDVSAHDPVEREVCYLGKALKGRNAMEKVTFTDQTDAIDFPKVTQMLSQAYWSPGIGMAEVQQGARNSSLVVGAFLPDGTQIGYARVISDKTRFAYILDLYIEEPYRKQGIGQALMKYILAHESHKDVYQWLLITRDAHGVYAKIGFKNLSRPLDWMEIRQERPKR